jgi:hypothetical protein
MGTLYEDVFTFMVNDEKYYRQTFWRKTKQKLHVQAFLLKSYPVRNTEE